MINIFNNNQLKKSFYILAFLLYCLINSGPVKAGECSNDFINPVSDINWQCIFPIGIGGILQLGDTEKETENLDDPVCVCTNNGINIGLNVSFWQPTVIIDTVKDAYCLNAIGTKMSGSDAKDGTLSVDVTGSGRSPEIFSHMHYYKFPLWKILNLFADLPCQQSGGFDIAIISELLPHWNSSILSALLHPEAAVFANPVAKLSCMTDAVSASMGKPIDSLFWCMGSWGGAYPFTGHAIAGDRIEANAGIAAKAIYMMARTGLLLDYGVDSCGGIKTPVWNKSHYKLQLMKPIKDSSCRSIGESGIHWTSGKDNFMGGGNYTWAVFAKTKCCAGF